MTKLSEMSCIWSCDDEDTKSWETECEEMFILLEGTPHLNGMKYCPFCGKLLVEEER